MEAAKLFDNLTWSDLVIIDNELKTVHEHKVTALKYKDLQTACSQLKIWGVR